VYFLEWIPYLPPVVIPSSPTIALDSVVEIIRDANAAPLVTTVSASNDPSYPVAINGLGFTDVASTNLQVKFWRGKVVAQGDFIVKSNTLIWSKVPAGATTGRVIVTNPYGSGASTNSFTP
jgi:hypothetical protein